jgi:hypothetical protein
MTDNRDSFNMRVPKAGSAATDSRGEFASMHFSLPDSGNAERVASGVDAATMRQPKARVGETPYGGDDGKGSPGPDFGKIPHQR